MSETPPPTELVRAIDILPGRFGMWTRFEDGEPFVNELCLRRWSDDKREIVFMFDSHNFLFAEPNEMLEVVRMPVRDFAFVDRIDAQHGFKHYSPCNRVRRYG